MSFSKKKILLSPLPHDKIRAPYQISNGHVKVNNSSMVNYVGNQSSVPAKYIGQTLTTQAIDGHLYICSNTQFIAVHKITNKHLNYIEKHYIEIAQKSYSIGENKLKELAKENLRLLGKGNTNE
ncbi:MAG: Mu transposase domain-containing protein [Succinivibrionaceae bacterium]